MAAEYQLLPTLRHGQRGSGMTETVLRVADGAYIPFDPANRDYQRFLEWKEAGNTPDPAPESPTT